MPPRAFTTILSLRTETPAIALVRPRIKQGRVLGLSELITSSPAGLLSNPRSFRSPSRPLFTLMCDSLYMYNKVSLSHPLALGPNVVGFYDNIAGPNSEQPTREKTHRRSCEECRRRKLRCSEQNPCSTCVGTGAECVFLANRRRSHKKKTPREKTLLSHLRRLEVVADQLSELELHLSQRPLEATGDNTMSENGA